MQASSSGTMMSSINVTPMIDVILVLLIIFMLITPVVQMGYRARVPQPAVTTPLPPSDQIVLQFAADGTIRLNQQVVPAEQFAATLRSVLGENTGKTVFFAGDPEAGYQETLDFLDLARSAGARNIALVVDEI